MCPFVNYATHQRGPSFSSHSICFLRSRASRRKRALLWCLVMCLIQPRPSPVHCLHLQLGLKLHSLILPPVILPHDSVTVCVYSSLCQACFVAVLEVYRVLQEVWWKQFPVDLLLGDTRCRRVLKVVAAPVAVTALVCYILFPFGPTLSRRQQVIHHMFH